MGFYFINVALKDDVQEIEKVVNSLNQPLTNLAHIELLDNNKAIAFYEWGHTNQQYFGSALLKKNLFGWKFVSGSSGQLTYENKLDWGFSNIAPYFSDYTDLLKGKILNPSIEKVRVETKSGNEYTANIVEYYNGEKFWFFITDGEELLDSTITGLSSDGEIIEEITR
ncbi:hypothetical protein [Alteribacillus sp. YIM 98480]|uniref:hypothetical protein n=1 Tax=Alteribacillus sp. YIM 98480 TaxID=2606599 RepID=UPI00131D5B78|nr:hypothetical protein [Alteribacillus sp. YIM 98480]